MTIRSFALHAALVSFGLSAWPALAASDNDSSSERKVCNVGHVYDEKQAKCVKKEEPSRFDDRQLYENAVALARAERFDEALDLLEQIENRNDPRVLNYLGYVTRNLGDLDGGLAFYRQAIALDPDYTLARSYMGQALLLSGDRDGAIVQLDEIEKRAGTGSREYVELAEALVAATDGALFRY